MINEEQFRIMVKFMERHGDLRCAGNGRQREKTKKKWLELVSLLNQHGEKKTFIQWSKVWSDTKYNTVKKYKRIVRGGPQLTDIENIIIKIIRNSQSGRKYTYVPVIENSPIVPIQNPIDNLSDCEKPLKEEVTIDTEEASNQEHPATSEKVFYVLPSDHQQDSLMSSNDSTKSYSPNKRRKSSDSVDRLDEIANKFYELERERDRMAHEREMARISQHSEFLNVMSRLVNVVENLAPSLQRFLDRNGGGGG